MACFSSCSQKETTLVWDKSYYEIGSQSSPKAADLNGDGVLDIVLGAGTSELAQTNYGVIAIDGKTGEELWTSSASAQIVGSATFYDINDDATPDVIIGGRNGNLKTLEGRTGETLWEYNYSYEEDPILKYARFNFYNSNLLPDQNNDGHPELLTVNGGNWDALPGSTEDRYPGVLMIMDVVNGTILAADTMPDGKESYMSPVTYTQPGTEAVQVLFGTGGETLSGNLYHCTLGDLQEGNLANAKIMAEGNGHGFIAPPVLTDITEDGLLDIVAMSHGGTITAIDGATFETVWTHTFPGMESSNSFAIGHFTGDATPDFFTMLSKGSWPLYSNAMQILFDGKTGEIAFQDSIGCFGLASPVAYDLDHDGKDEVIFSVNDYECDMDFNEDTLSPPTINNQVVFLDFERGSPQVIDQTVDFKNIFSSPWIGDLNGDGYLDLIYCQYFNPGDLMLYLGMRVKRVSTSIPMGDDPKWGEYMGAGGKSIYTN